MKTLSTFRLFSTTILMLINAACFSQPTWTSVATQAPFKSGSALTLLSDGSVLCKSNAGISTNVGNMWMKLTPNNSGSYVNGTWSLIQPMAFSRLYFSSQLLKDGRLYVSGGEYGTGSATSEIYDPVLNTWVTLPSPGGLVGDANSTILDNGNILQGYIGPPTQAQIYNPVTNTYSIAPSTSLQQSESTWIKLKDNSILFVGYKSTSTERYIPSLNQWVPDANTPVNLYDVFGGETGPAILLPDGRALFLGSMGNSAIYTPSGNNSPGTWVTGPSLPLNTGCPDTPAAMLVDGKILLTASKNPTSVATLFTAPTYFFEYDYVSNSFTQVPSFLGGPTIADTAFKTTLINLPDGNVLITEADTYNYYVGKPAGTPLAAGKPTITSVAQNGCTNTFTLTGMLFNGISEGSSFGDDWQMNTNYPIVQLKSGVNVYYARTHHWNHTGVQRGTLQDTTLFDLPGNIPNGTYSLYVIANGISSNPLTFTFTPFPGLISPLIANGICSGSTFTYNAVANTTAATIQWTRPSVAGISNPPIVVPQTTNPNEVLTNTTTIPLTVVYHYTITNGSCINYNYVSVVVNTSPPLNIVGNTNICSGKTSTLSVVGLNTYTWSTTSTTNPIFVNPTVTTSYSVTGINPYGCLASKLFTITVKPSPSLSITGNTILCIGDSTILTASGDGGAYLWNSTITDNTVSVKPNTTVTYSVVSFGSNGCTTSDTIRITVQDCTGIKELFGTISETTLYPNPLKNDLLVECKSNKESFCVFEVINLVGTTFLNDSTTLTTGKNKIKLNTSTLLPGIYILKIHSNTIDMRYKIIKE